VRDLSADCAFEFDPGRLGAAEGSVGENVVAVVVDDVDLDGAEAATGAGLAAVGDVIISGQI
jgi:hypothetical protein